MRSLLALLMGIGLLAGSADRLAAQAKVIKVEEETVHIGVGVDREVKTGTVAEIYRQTEPIIHPVTGENLGSPKVKVAEIEITKVGPTFSSGTYVVKYAPVKVGDLVEGLEVAPTAEEQMRSEVADARAEIKALAMSLAQEIKANKKGIDDLRGTLRRLSSSERRLTNLINAVANVRERMVVIEGHVRDLEAKQQAIIEQDSAEVQALSAENWHELNVLRRGDEEAIYLKVGDRFYRLSFEEDRLIEETPMAMAAAGTGAMPAAEAEADMSEEMGLFDEETEEEEATPWYLAYWWVAPIVGLLGAVLLFIVKAMRRPVEDEPEEGAAEEQNGFIEVADDEEMIEDIPEPDDLEVPEPEQ
ncbi:MAG: hypothetical protein QGI83_10155 [Candidatus Latescibacteria bacterium]|jgi:hypothetical protein|nr:hypothetical protein [Candidatus Latescibacterota bacterium]